MKKIHSLILVLLFYALPSSASSNGYYRGDIDGNKMVTMADLAQLIKLIRTNPADMPEAADVNGDKKVNLDDVSAIVEIILGRADKVWVSLPDNISTDGTTTSGDADDTEYNGEFDAKRRK